MRVAERCAALAAVSDAPDLLVRAFASAAMARANALVGDWMVAAGLTVRVDAGGNLVGHRPGTDPAAGTLLLGSHLDTVRDAGAFDGPLGVLVAIEALARRTGPLPFAVDVLGFSDEEGLRFGTAYLGSRAVAGTFPPALLGATDSTGASVGEALRAFGTDPIETASRAGERVIGYVEVHLEQGPVLEAAGEPLGVVEAIAGATRAQVTFRGAAGHAGTVPMAGRRDALTAAAEWILAVEAVATWEDVVGLVATVGALTPAPGAPNVIAGVATATLDVRHADDAVRRDAVARIESAAHDVALRRGLTVEWRVTHDAPAVAMDARLTAALARAADRRAASAAAPADARAPAPGDGARRAAPTADARAAAAVPRLVSGAGHDAVAMADLCPVGMLFVRCRGGVSHSPAEHVADADCEAAVVALGAFLDEAATWT